MSLSKAEAPVGIVLWIMMIYSPLHTENHDVAIKSWRSCWHSYRDHDDIQPPTHWEPWCRYQKLKLLLTHLSENDDIQPPTHWEPWYRYQKLKFLLTQLSASWRYTASYTLRTMMSLSKAEAPVDTVIWIMTIYSPLHTENHDVAIKSWSSYWHRSMDHRDIQIHTNSIMDNEIVWCRYRKRKRLLA